MTKTEIPHRVDMIKKPDGNCSAMRRSIGAFEPKDSMNNASPWLDP